MNNRRTQQEWLELAKQSKEKSVPEGWVYVGMGCSVDLGFGYHLVMKGPNDLSWDKNNLSWDNNNCCGNNVKYEYICPIELWETRTELKFSGEPISVKDVRAKAKTSNEDLAKEFSRVTALSAKAVELVGRTINYQYKTVKGAYLVKAVNLDFDMRPSPKILSGLVSEFYNKYGYVITLEGNLTPETGSSFLPYDPSFVSINKDVVINNVKGEDKGDYWDFGNGCAKIGKDILLAAKTFLESKSGCKDANKKPETVKIGAGVFDLETINRML